MKVCEKFILLSEIESRDSDVCMCVVIRKEDEKNRENDAWMCDVIDRENGNDCMCAVAINAKVNFEFRVTALVYKFVRKLKRNGKIKI